MDFHAVLERTLDWLTGSGLRILLIIVLTIVALRLARWLATRLFAEVRQRAGDIEMKKRTDTLSSIVRYILSAAILVTALIMILGEFGIQIGPILAAAGIVGVAVGFGAQYLVQDVINGFFILLNDEIRVGDVVSIGDNGGVVEAVNLRTTILRDLSGNVHYIRNGTISTVTNMTKEFSCYLFNIGVAYREDVDEVIRVIKEIDEEMRKDPEFKDDILKPLEVMGLDQFADSAIIIKARTTTKPVKQWRIGREFNRRMKRKFDELNIEIPFPHVTFYPGREKDGTTPPLHMVSHGQPQSDSQSQRTD
jgi:small-conductance mechanosensitive channel